MLLRARTLAPVLGAQVLCSLFFGIRGFKILAPPCSLSAAGHGCWYFKSYLIAFSRHVTEANLFRRSIALAATAKRQGRVRFLLAASYFLLNPIPCCWSAGEWGMRGATNVRDIWRECDDDDMFTLCYYQQLVLVFPPPFLRTDRYYKKCRGYICVRRRSSHAIQKSNSTVISMPSRPGSAAAALNTERPGLADDSIGLQALRAKNARVQAEHNRQLLQVCRHPCSRLRTRHSGLCAVTVGRVAAMRGHTGRAPADCARRCVCLAEPHQPADY